MFPCSWCFFTEMGSKVIIIGNCQRFDSFQKPGSYGKIETSTRFHPLGWGWVSQLVHFRVKFWGGKCPSNEGCLMRFLYLHRYLTGNVFWFSLENSRKVWGGSTRNSPVFTSIVAWTWLYCSVFFGPRHRETFGGNYQWIRTERTGTLLETWNPESYTGYRRSEEKSWILWRVRDRANCKFVHVMSPYSGFTARFPDSNKTDSRPYRNDVNDGLWTEENTRYA